MASTAQKFERAILEEEEALLVAAAAVILLDTSNKKRKKRRSVWTRDWLLRRPLYGQYECLLAELNREDSKGYKNFLRIDNDFFMELVATVGPRIRKQDTWWRQSLEPGLKIAITLRYMATGDSYRSLHYGFRVGYSTIGQLVVETCLAMIEQYGATDIPSPRTPEEWKKVAEAFARKWNFHNCLGALDGKHVAIRAPPKSGTFYHNYKGFFSLVLLALVDANYKFIFVDIGAHGSFSDAGIFNTCNLCKAIENGTAGIPEPQSLPHHDKPTPYAIVGDDAFALRTWLMKPYPNRGLTRAKRLFNYRLSRARRVSENAFGILTSRFRCMSNSMLQLPENVKVIVMACCIMHNMLIDRNTFPNLDETDLEDPTPPDTHQLVELERLTGNTSHKNAKDMRDYLCNYYNSPVGRVKWQDKMI